MPPPTPDPLKAADGTEPTASTSTTTGLNITEPPKGTKTTLVVHSDETTAKSLTSPVIPGTPKRTKAQVLNFTALSDDEDEDELTDEELEALKKIKKTTRCRVSKFYKSLGLVGETPNPQVTPDIVNVWKEDLKYATHHLFDGKEEGYKEMINRIMLWFSAQTQQPDDVDDEFQDSENIGDYNTDPEPQQNCPTKAPTGQQSSTEPPIVDFTSLSINGTPLPPRAITSVSLNPFSQHQQRGLPLPNSKSPLMIAQQPLATVNAQTSQPNSQQPPTVGYTPTQHPFTYTKINTEVDPFDGSPLNFGYFVRLFELKYEANPFMSPLDQFLKFSQLVGKHGKEFMRNLSPDANGLSEAKRRLKQHYGNKTTIEMEARDQLNKLSPVTSDRQVGQLRYNLEKIESLVSSLTDCGISLPVLNHSYYSSIVKKFPFTIINSFTLANNGEDDLMKVLAHIRKKMELSAQTVAVMGLPMTNRQNSRINSIESTPSEQTFNQNRSGPAGRVHPSGNSRSFTFKCNLCNGPHKTIFCTERTAAERKRIALQKKLCFLCLGQSHQLNECQSPYQCPCGGRHSKVICTNNGPPAGSFRIPRNTNTSANGHVNSQRNGPQAGTNGTSGSNSNENSSSMNAITTQGPETTGDLSLNQIGAQSNRVPPDNDKSFSQTVLVRINGHVVRMLLDTGADRTVVTPNMATKLNLTDYGPTDRTFICAYNGKRKCTNRYIATVESLDGSDSLEVIFYELSMKPHQKPGLPNEQHEQLEQLGYPISDAKEYEKDQYPIEITIGIDCYMKLWYDTPIPLENGLFVQASKFGWIVAGLTNSQSVLNHSVSSTFGHSNHLKHMILFSPGSSPLELDYLNEYSSSKIKYEHGKYTAELPWLDPVRMGDNRIVALKRFQLLLNQLSRKDLMEEYSKEMETLINNYAEIAPAKCTPGRTNRLPHHPVVNRKKTTSQVRPVFDGSCKSGNQRSLNENIYKGINAWDSLGLLLKFRFGSTAVSADIEKAYLMINIATKDRDALRFYWLDKDGKTAEYRFKVVPFGTSASPFLLFAVMKHHFDNFRTKYPDIIELIENNFYVDDLLLAMAQQSRTLLLKKQQDITELMSLAGMNIRKFRTNDPELDKLWAPDAKEFASVLGHLWNVRTDSLSLNCDIDHYFSAQPITKRIYQSFIASIYDPSGLTMPFTVMLRTLQCQLWQLKVGWDEPLSQSITQEIHDLMTEARLISEVSVPRNVTPQDEQGELLVYCDANHHVIGVAAYCLTTTSCNLIMTKAKLVSNGRLISTDLSNSQGETEAINGTIPENELNGLLMAAKCVTKLKELQQFSAITILSDSLVNLQRVDKHPNTMKPSIALKINQLKALSGVRIRHIESKLNIADLITKGCTMTQLLANAHWWTGPPLPNVTLYSILNVITSNEVDPCPEFSCYEKAIGAFRQIANWSMKRKPHEYELTTTENLALIYLIRNTQALHFKDEIRFIKVNPRTKVKSSILSNYLCFIDENGLLRMDTRLGNVINMSYDQKYPIIMPGECCISKLILEFEHRRLNHVGVDRTLDSVRDHYFIIHAKRMAKTIRHDCYTCKLINAKTIQTTFGSVPSFRTDDTAPPFANTGIDIFGPLKVSTTTPGKRYGLIFSCATTRAVHLELLLNMTAAEVFQAMRRFFARRGYPQLFYSDNGTQFLKIRLQLKTFVNQIKEANPSLNINLEWQLQTALSPWRGGFYERLIKIAKESLTAMTLKKKVTDHELTTYLYEIESRMNSRPLFKKDGETVTPAHFFRARSLASMPPIGNNIARQLERTDLIDYYIKSLRCQNAVWIAWRQKYLKELKLFHQNKGPNNTEYQLKVGDVVLLKNNDYLTDWPLGIVEEVFPKADGVIHTAIVRTTDHRHIENKKRAVQTLIPLECCLESDAHSTASQQTT